MSHSSALSSWGNEQGTLAHAEPPDIQLEGKPLPREGPESGNPDPLHDPPPHQDAPRLPPVHGINLNQRVQSSAPLENVLRLRSTSHEDPNTNHASFWGFKLLQEVLTRDTVIHELASEGRGGFDPKDAAKWGNLVVPHHGSHAELQPKPPSFLRIFALLVLINRTCDIEKILSNLDFYQELSDGAIQLPKDYLLDNIAKRCEWSSLNCDCARQHWRGLLAHNFDMDMDGRHGDQELDLDPRTLLPWVKDATRNTDSSWVKAGGFGTVSKHRIDPHSHNFEQLLNLLALYSEFVAVKSLNSKKASDFQQYEREAAMLKRFGFNGGQQRRDRHIIMLLAAYKIGEDRCFVFPAAECDLREYFQHNHGPLEALGSNSSDHGKLDHVDTMRWISEQILRLVAAVKFFHVGNRSSLQAREEFARHGDLKPENILWFKTKNDEKGILVIGDLGITDVRGLHSRSNVPNENLHTTPSYRAPECDMLDGTISRAYDIWSLGCVFLEIISWILGGEKLRSDFSNERMKTSILQVQSDTYFHIERLQNESYSFTVKKNVIEFVKMLHCMPTCSSYIHDLLDLVSTGMLRVFPEHRLPIQTIHQKLEEMKKKITSDVDYLMKHEGSRSHADVNAKDERISPGLNPLMERSWRLALLLGGQNQG